MDRTPVTSHTEAGRRLRAPRFRLRDDVGQTAAEYIGIIVIVAAILLMINGTEIGTTLRDGLNTAISQILGG